MESSTADPVATSVRFHLAALLSPSAGRDMQVFLLRNTSRCIKLSRAERQTDGRQRHARERKTFFFLLLSPRCASGGRRVPTVWLFCFFSSEQNKPSSLFLPSVELSPLNPSGDEARKSLGFALVEIHKSTSWTFSGTCFCF